MKKTIFSFALASALAMMSGLPVVAQQSDKGTEQVFAQLDSNKDGKLSQTEFNRLFDMEGKKTPDQEKQAEFKAWDADGDGSISKAEFAAQYQK
jgi:Ca2+-binding EF-hand superfamily protein